VPRAGQILYHKNFIFIDGNTGTKLVVVLNTGDNSEISLILKTTSQSKRYEGVGKGCNPQKRVFFVPAGWQRCFKLDTYIQLSQILEISTEKLLKGVFSKNIRMIDSLSADCFAQLKNCLKQFKDDISTQHWKLIFK